MLLGNADTFEDLNAFFVAFFDLDVNFDGIAWPEGGKVRTQLLFLDHI